MAHHTDPKFWVLFNLTVSALVVVVANSSPVRAEAITPVCRNYVQASAKLTYDDKRHAGWYHRFWNGKCNKVPLPEWILCQAGVHVWNDVVRQAISESKAENKTIVQREICELGQLAGFEWAKDNDIRCVHTSDLPKMSKTLTAKGLPVLERIRRVRKQVTSQLGCR